MGVCFLISFVILMVEILIYFFLPDQFFNSGLFYNSALFSYVCFFIFKLFLLFRNQSEKLNEKILTISTISISVPIFWFLFTFCFMGIGIPEIEKLPHVKQNATYVYFSIVTFTTLGYGDFFPGEETRFYAAGEAVVGFLFVPLILSQLVSIINIQPVKGQQNSKKNQDLVDKLEKTIDGLDSSKTPPTSPQKK